MVQLLDCLQCKDAGSKKYSFLVREMVVHQDEHRAASLNVLQAFEEKKETNDDLSLQVALRSLLKEEIRRWIRRSRGDNTLEVNHVVKMRCSEEQFLRIFGKLPLLLKGQRYSASVGGLPGHKLLERCLGVDWDTYELKDGTTYFVATQVAEYFSLFLALFWLLTNTSTGDASFFA